MRSYLKWACFTASLHRLTYRFDDDGLPERHSVYDRLEHYEILAQRAAGVK
jgi:hypothetical protein